VSGDPDTVHEAGVSARGRVGVNEVSILDDDLEDWIVNWPLQVPGKVRKGSRETNR